MLLYVFRMVDKAAPVDIDMREHNKGVIAEFRTMAGKNSNHETLVLLTTVGAKSGRPHTAPLGVCEDRDRLIVAGSIAGKPDHPQWYRNLVAQPEVTVEYRGDVYRARASTVPNGPDRDRLFALMSTRLPHLYEFQDRCRDTRQIPIVLIERR